MTLSQTVLTGIEKSIAETTANWLGVHLNGFTTDLHLRDVQEHGIKPNPQRTVDGPPNRIFVYAANRASIGGCGGQVPPGLLEYLDNVQFKVQVDHGRSDWMEYPAVKKFTNAFIIDEQAGKILLGYKKRNFAKGIYNGFGGKVEPGETSLQAARRELQEEACIEAPLEHCGFLLFYQTGHDYAHHIDLYRANSWVGEPTETDEMKPSWFDLPSPEIDPLAVFKVLLEEEPEAGETASTTVPFHKMWRDDILWMPFLISKRRFVGRVDLVDGASSDAENPYHPMVKWWFATVEE